jgi:hypothetical protein
LRQRLTGSIDLFLTAGVREKGAGDYNAHYASTAVVTRRRVSGQGKGDRRSIRKGEELTNDYREFEPGFCAAFLKKKRKSKRAPRAKAAPLPHRSVASGFRLCLGKYANR